MFTWSYEEMFGLDPSLVEHGIVLNPRVKIVKQRLRRLHPRPTHQVKTEVDQLNKAKFIRVVLYPHWVTNIVLIMQKNESIWICVDFKDLN